MLILYCAVPTAQLGHIFFAFEWLCTIHMGN